MTCTTRMRLLGELRPGSIARISSVDPGADADEQRIDLIRRLLEMGLLEGAEIEVMHEAPFGGDPLAVRVRGSLIALRRSEANLVRVVLTGGGK